MASRWRRIAALAAGLGLFTADCQPSLGGSVAVFQAGVVALVGLDGSRRALRLTALATTALSVLAWMLANGSLADLPGLLRLCGAIFAIVLTDALCAHRLDLQVMRTRLEHSEAEIVTFADSVPHMLWRSTPDGRWDFLNRRFTEITGVERADGIANQTWRQCVHPDDLLPLREQLASSLVTGEDVTAKVRLKQKDGSYRWMSMARRAVISPETGRIMRFYGGSTDVHEEVLAQERIHELMTTLEQRVAERTEELLSTQARYARLFDLGNISFAEIDVGAVLPLLDAFRTQGVQDLRAHLAANPDLLSRCLDLVRTSRVNKALATMMGDPALDAQAAQRLMLDCDDGREMLLVQLEMAFGGIDHADGRAVLIGRDRRTIAIYYTINRLAGDLHVATCVDLSELERIAELRRSARDELARANRVATIGAYSATIAHELNQPIASMALDVQTTLRWLSATEPNVEAAQRVIERLTRTVERVRGIVGRTRENLIAHRREIQPFDLAALVVETCDLIEPVVRREGASLSLHCDRGFAPLAADPIELQQVFVNLITNAAEAMHQTDGPRRIEVSVHDRADGIHIAVSDTGPGIPPDQRERLFEPFYTTKPAGMGMGLQVCRNAVENMGGVLTVGAGAAGGAVFSFVLPADGHDLGMTSRLPT